MDWSDMRSEKWADILATATVLLLVFGVVAVPVIGLGLALGYGLRAVIPGLDTGWAIVAGAVFATGIVDMTARLLLAVHDMKESDEQEEVPTHAPWVTIPRSFLPPTGRKRGRKR
jgi:hypothetical protein